MAYVDDGGKVDRVTARLRRDTSVIRGWDKQLP